MKHFLSLLRGICGFGCRDKASRVWKHSHNASAVTKLVDGGEVKGELFADVGLQLDGVESYLKRLKLLTCYIFPSMNGLPQEQCGTQEEHTRITRNSNVSITLMFLHIWQNPQTRPLHPPPMCSTESGFRCSLFHGCWKPCGPSD